MTLRLHFGLAVLLAGCADGASGAPPPAPTSDPSATTVALASSASGSASTAAAPSVPPTSAPASDPPSPLPAGMVAVPEGLFHMGGEGLENTPVHEVAVARFLLDDAEVTVDAYAACVEKGKCKPARKGMFCNADVDGRGDHPINCVDHHEAAAFCAHVEKRLPSEREWEYAARGGADQRLYSWGDEIPDRKRACYMHEGGSCAVRSFPAGAFGLYDMTGNVWEWTGTWFSPFPHESVNGRFKVYRGGSWSRRFPKWMRNDLRNRYRPDEQSAALGFRCAKDHAPLTCPTRSVADGDRCRLEGATPDCPVGLTWTHGACRVAGVEAWTGPANAGASAAPVVQSGKPGAAGGKPGGESGSDAVSAPSASAAAQLGRSRSPSFDADCERHYKGKPIAYQITGGAFHDREPLVSASGCTKRDVGRGWTSVCCAQ